MNNIILKNRLDQCGITIDDVLSKIKFKGQEASVFIYTSHLENLGNKDSDFDIYVITNIASDENFARNHNEPNVQIEILNGFMLDIEHWQLSTINNFIKRLNEDNAVDFNREELSLIHRLKASVIIKGKDEGNKIKKSIQESKFDENVMKYQSIYAKSILEDAVGMYNSKRYIPALNCARIALEYSIGALNAKYGFTTLKSKWNSKIFLDNKDCPEVYHNQYLKLQIYPNITKDNLISHVEELIEFSQDILSGLYV